MEPTTSNRGSRGRAAWAGVAFAVLYVAGMILSNASPSNLDDVNDNPTKLAAAWRRYYSDSGHRWTILIGAWILTAAALALIVFGSALRDRLAGTGAPGAGRLALAGSILFGAVTLAGAVGLAWIPGAKQLGTVAVPTGELNYLSSQLGFGILLLGGGAAAALLLVTAGAAGARSGALPGWLGWAGAVIGVLLFFFAVTFVPMALLVLWVLIASIVMLRRPLIA
jgi:hypothetical protein